MSVARLSHPNILSIFEFAQDAGTAFVVMELVDGETLRARLARPDSLRGEPSRTRSRSPRASAPPTRAASCIAISSPRT